MGTTYTAEVFFGTFVKRRTPLGMVLETYIEEQGGTPATTGIAGVVICEAGSHPTGKVWMVVRADGSGHSFERGDDIKAPQILTEDPSWRPALASFFEALKMDPPPIGWHFAGSVS